MIDLENLIALQERIAAALWKSECATGPASVHRARTLEAFRQESPATKAKWLAFASAVIMEIMR